MRPCWWALVLEGGGGGGPGKGSCDRVPEVQAWLFLYGFMIVSPSVVLTYIFGWLCWVVDGCSPSVPLTWDYQIKCRIPS